MVPVSSSVVIDVPREQVFAYLSDIANHPEFTDHYLVDWHLTREESRGRGAGARFRIKAPGSRFAWGDVTLAEVESPHCIVEIGRGGKENRTRLRAVYEITAAAGGATRVRFTLETQPAMLSDRLMESLGQRGWFKRQNNRAMRRLRSILEEGADRGARATMAAR